MPVIGEESIICFSDQKEACVVKTVDYKVMKFSEITKELTKLEGEGDLSLDYWIRVHYNFFKEYNPNFDNNTLIVCEIFVINVGGYIGDSTRTDIENAKSTNKKIKYLESFK